MPFCKEGRMPPKNVLQVLYIDRPAGFIWAIGVDLWRDFKFVSNLKFSQESTL
jgi:hypothetical protein